MKKILTSRTLIVVLFISLLTTAFAYIDSSNSSLFTSSENSVKDTFKTRGCEIAQSFDLDTSEYKCLVNSDIKEYLHSIEDYLSIKQNLSLSFGDTIPVYFLSEDGNTLFVVKQDSASTNHLFTFEKDKDDEGDWSLNDNVETCLSDVQYTEVS